MKIRVAWLTVFLLVLGICTDAVLADLIAYWPFEEGQGTTTADVTGNGNDGTFNGSVEWVPGYIGSAVSFDTAGERIVVGPLDPTEGTNAMTLAAWIFWEGQGHSIEHQGIIGKRLGWTTTGATIKWFWEATPASALLFRADYSGGGTGLWWGNTFLEPYANEWTHVALTWDDGTAIQYINGEEVSSGNITFRDTANDTPVTIGCVDSTNNETFVGSIDEVRIFNHALSVDEIQTIMIGEFPTAYKPNPAAGAMHPDTWVSLSWESGTAAASHDVYFGDNFDDVNDGTGDTFRGNQTLNFFIAGFIGYPYPDGLVFGTTYYWRIDEVNDAHPDSPWKGEVWSFTIPPKKAYNPVPADGAKFLEPDVKLSWSGGFGTKLHNVYFGENFDDVDAGTGGTAKGPAGTPAFNIGTLEPGKTYYWRIDEFDGFETHKGDTWTFTTAGPGGGLRADYYKGMNFENLALTRTDPQIDFNWGDPGGPDPAVGDDNFSVRWTGEVEAAFIETYTFYPRTDDGVRLWVDGQQLVDRWVDRSAAEDKATIALVAGNTYSLVMEYYENGGGAVAELSWSSPRTPKQIIPQAALSLPLKASSPSPRSGSVDVKQTTDISWGPGDEATSHEVYFGTDEEAVRNATTASPEFKGTKALGDESYDPGNLEWATMYYWRIDEVNNANPDSPWVGNVWSFTTADFLIVDDFELYNDLDPGVEGSNRIFLTWIDGYEKPANGSQVGYLDPPFCEQTIVHGGSQSMPLFYDNSGPANYSEATLPLTYPRDWTEEGIGVLSLWFRGNPAAFIEAPAGTYTMSGSGTDIWNSADEFRYAYKQLSGDGEIIAQVLSVEQTDGWAKAGVMIRETLDPGSKHAFCCITPANGKSFQNRKETNQRSWNSNTAGFAAPYWVRLVRQGNTFTAYHSADGVNWILQAASDETANPETIPMATNVYIGLALTSHNPDATCVAGFSDVQTTGTVSPAIWTNQAIGVAMASNAPEPMFVAISNATGPAAVVYHDNPNAAVINTWTQWNINLEEFSTQGVVLTNVDSLSIGFGDRNNPQVGGSGLMFIDDIRLYRPTP